jgi:M6 family metalloprotease-like protein
MLIKLMFGLAAAAWALGIGATANAQSDKNISTKSFHKRDHQRVNTAKIPPQVGEESWVVLLCRFADSPTPVPFTTATYDAAFNTDPKSHKKYFAEASYGKLQLSFTVRSWKTIATRSTFPGDFRSRGEPFLFEIYDACTAAHDATVNFSQYNGILMFFDDREKDTSDGSACGYGDTCTTDRRLGLSGYAYFNLDRGPLDGKSGFRAVWMATHEGAHNEVTAHEIHHAYGAPHSSAGTEDLYDDECFDSFSFQDDLCGHAWDLMAGAWTSLPTDTHTLASTKVFHHKWISGTPRRCNVARDTPADGTVFQLERLAKPRENDRCLAITISVPGSDAVAATWYVVEARFPVGFDADSSTMFAGGGVPGPAVIISRLCIGTHFACNPQPVVLGRDMDGNFSIDELATEWQPGETFVNFNGTIKVQVLSRGSGFYTVRVIRDSTP